MGRFFLEMSPEDFAKIKKDTDGSGLGRKMFESLALLTEKVTAGTMDPRSLPLHDKR